MQPKPKAALDRLFALARTGYLTPRADTRSGARTSVWDAELAAETEKLRPQTVYVAAHVYKYTHYCFFAQEACRAGVRSGAVMRRGANERDDTGGLPRVLLRSRQTLSSHDSASFFLSPNKAHHASRITETAETTEGLP